MDNLREIGEFVSSPQFDRERGSEWYALFFAFRCSHTILLSIVWEPFHPFAAEWREMITATAIWFRSLRSMHQLAQSYAQILENVVGSIPVEMDATDMGRTQAPTLAVEDPLPGQLAPAGLEDMGMNAPLDFERYW